MVHNGAICNQSTPYEADFRLDCLRNTPRRTCFAYDEGIKLHGGENTVWTVDRQAAGVYVSRAAGCRGSRGCLHQCWHLQDPVPSENPAKIDRLPPGLVKRARTDTNWSQTGASCVVEIISPRFC